MFRNNHLLHGAALRVLLAAALMGCCWSTPSQTPTASTSASTSATASPSPTASPFAHEACPSCPASTFIYTGAFQFIDLTAAPFNASTHLQVFLWGGQGGGMYDSGGSGAFVSGVLPIAGLGPTLRVVVGIAAGLPSELTGGGGNGTGCSSGCEFQTSGGGRSALQVPSIERAEGWVDIVTAGGGPGYVSSTPTVNVASADAGGASFPTSGLRNCFNRTSCLRGMWLRGQGMTWGAGGAYSAAAGSGGGGGVGWGACWRA